MKYDAIIYFVCLLCAGIFFVVTGFAAQSAPLFTAGIIVLLGAFFSVFFQD